MRKLGFLVAIPIVGALMGVAPAVAQPAPNVTAFCDAALNADKASYKVFGAARPKQKDLQALVAAFTQVQGGAPAELTASVQEAADAARNAAQAGKDPSQDAAFLRNLNAINEYRYNSCGYQTVDVTATEYEFVGLPKTVKPGPVAIKLTDTGAELHELASFRLKTKDSVKKVLGLSNKEQNSKIERTGGTIVLQGDTTYVVVDMSKPGRYGVACFLPVGSTSAQEAEAKSHQHGGTPHWKKGMYGTITSRNA
ncbi:MAG TPA: hypothetical protein VGK05_07000 [Acidimicrobiia bacterium]|jgi:hypothetical protein